MHRKVTSTEKHEVSPAEDFDKLDWFKYHLRLRSSMFQWEQLALVLSAQPVHAHDISVQHGAPDVMLGILGLRRRSHTAKN